jgi:SOS-response transcriptional repressor LexA
MPTAAAADPEAVRRLVRLGLTEKQALVYLYIFTTAMECGFQPSIREMLAHMGLNSPNSMVLIIDGLEISGFVGRNRNDSRCLKLLRTPSGEPFRGFVLPEDTP